MTKSSAYNCLSPGLFGGCEQLGDHVFDRLGLFDDVSLGYKLHIAVSRHGERSTVLLAEKKAAYADYRKAREEMKELLTAKANIDRILELDKEQEEANERREKEAEQR